MDAGISDREALRQTHEALDRSQTRNLALWYQLNAANEQRDWLLKNIGSEVRLAFLARFGKVD